MSTPHIIGVVLDDTAMLLERVRTILEAGGEGTAAALGDVDDTLTAGYARALALEAEQRRLDQRILGLAGQDGGDPNQLAVLAERRTRTLGDLTQLRTALRTLREHRSAQRARVQPAA